MAKELGRVFGLIKETRINKEGAYQDALGELYVAVESRFKDGCKRLPKHFGQRRAIEFHGHPFYYHNFDEESVRPEDISSIRCTFVSFNDLHYSVFPPENYHESIFHIVVLASPAVEWFHQPPSIEIATLSKFITPKVRLFDTERFARYGGQFVLHYVHFQLDLGLWLYKEDVQFKEKKMSEEVMMDPNTVEGVKKMAKVVNSWHLVDSRNPDHPDYKPPPKPEETVWGG